MAGTVVSATNVPGRLLPVTTASLRRQPELFALNERLVHRIESENGPVAVVMVAAFGVGHMSCAYLDMPIHPQRVTQVNCEPAVNCNAGDELGTFHLGSTVVLLFGKGQLTALREQGPIRMGQALARWNPA